MKYKLSRINQNLDKMVDELESIEEDIEQDSDSIKKAVLHIEQAQTMILSVKLKLLLDEFNK